MIKEVIAFVDFYSDLNILVILSYAHPIWCSLNVLLVLAPFIVLYIPFVNFLIRGEIQMSQGKSARLRFLQILCMSPAIFLLFLVIDQIYMIQGTIYPIVLYPLLRFTKVLSIIILILLMPIHLVLRLCSFLLIMPLAILAMIFTCNFRCCNWIENGYTAIFRYVTGTDMGF